ncbi:MAG: hypothetical protein WAN74_00500 [Thermoplasmata archaeon]
MALSTVHRELLLAPPVEDPPKWSRLLFYSDHPLSLEIHRATSGAVRYFLGATVPRELATVSLAIENTFPRTSANTAATCRLVGRELDTGLLLRARPHHPNNFWPLRVGPDVDLAGTLLRALASSQVRDHEVVLQLLFQRVTRWERSLFAPRYETLARTLDPRLRAKCDARRSDQPYHFEMRAWLGGTNPRRALPALGHWLSQWTAIDGGAQWRWEEIKPKKRARFATAFRAHDIRAFANRKSRRDVSAFELTRLLSIPWQQNHPEIAYAGAPLARAPPQLAQTRPLQSRPRDGPLVRGLALPPPSQVSRPIPIPERRPPLVPASSGVVVGRSCGAAVRLPDRWNHLAILGRTQSGKSTLMLNLALQILAQRPDATVVVMEPTGNLIGDIRTHLSDEVAADAVEIDPAHPTFQEGAETMVSVPLNPLHLPNRAGMDPAAIERWSEMLAGDILRSIKNAWGEESVGGRADFILRGILQGLLATPGTNLVDAYSLLSDKDALRRFVTRIPEGPLRQFLEVHLPSLNYTFTISSLDKVGKIATNPMLRKALCQRAHPVSFDQLLRHRLLLLNLSKGSLGAEGSQFLGAIFLTQLWAALQRSGSLDHPVYLVVDELHHYAVPAFGEMLNEGAKFGLHVIAATQYLHHIPAETRLALQGNVALWLLFSLGAEDMEPVWKMVDGQRHGWTPQDLVSGLRPHEVALHLPGTLVKVSTLPPPPPDPEPGRSASLLVKSSRRYAAREDSEASPLFVTADEVALVLRALSAGPATSRELATRASLPPERCEAILARCRSAGDVSEDPAKQAWTLSRRGIYHLLAIEAQRNEGEVHTELVADTCAQLAQRGIEPHIPIQRSGVLLPDAEFTHEGTTYNLEVECSTLATHVEQVSKNVRKALKAGRKCLVVVPNREAADRVARVIGANVPEARLWNEFGLLWREDGGFHPYPGRGSDAWPLVTTGAAGPATNVAPPASSQPPSPGEPRAATFTDPGVATVARAAGLLQAEGKRWVTFDDFEPHLPATDGRRWTEWRLGVALDALGVEGQRVQRAGSRFRIYDLGSLDPAGLDPSSFGFGVP